MGRFWLGILLLITFLILGLWTAGTMESVHQAISDDLMQATDLALAGALEEGVVFAENARSEWESHWYATACVADHEPMDEIDSLFAQLDAYANAGAVTEFAAYCARLSGLVTAMGEAHGFTWWNFL